MTPRTLFFLLTIIELMRKYGLTAAIHIIRAWQVPEGKITVEDIKNLGLLVPRPETYFKKKPTHPMEGLLEKEEREKDRQA